MSLKNVFLTTSDNKVWLIRRWGGINMELELSNGRIKEN